MDIGESISVALGLIDKGLCVICDGSHKEPKKVVFKKKKIAETKKGWKRSDKVSELYDGRGEKKALYKSFPPKYKTEGHHCIAFVHFVQKDTDVCFRLNYFLDEFKYAPSRKENIIQLPGRRPIEYTASGGTWPKAVKKEYKNFWFSNDEGYPLQLHTGRHRGSYFVKSLQLMRDLLEYISDPDECEDENMDEFKDKLLDQISKAENFAYKNVAESEWKCHPEHLRIAEDLYSKDSKNRHSYVYLGSKGRKTKMSEYGYEGKGDAPIKWQQLNGLDTGDYI